MIIKETYKLAEAYSSSNRTYKMFRYICTVFVALTACQAAFASVAAERKIVELELAEQTSPTIELLDSLDLCASKGKDFVMGARKAGEKVYTLNYVYNNSNNNRAMHLELGQSLPAGKKLIFMSAKNRADSNVVICSSYNYLQTSKAVVLLKIPPYTKATVNFILTAL